MQLAPANGIMRQAAPVVKRQTASQWLLRLIVLALLLSALAINYWLWVPPDKGLQQLQQLQSEIHLQQQQNDTLSRRNNAVKADIESLQQGLDAIEERARSDMGMIREGETFFRIVEPDSDNQ